MRSWMCIWASMALLAAVAFLPTPAAAAEELVLAENGASAYQIVVPDTFPDAAIAGSLRQTARLIQAAFKASGVDLPISAEGERGLGRPAIYLGATRFARQHGCDPETLEGWDYYHKVVDRSVILVGRDHAPPTPPEGVELGSRDRFFYRQGTLKAATDFLRRYTMTYFLYPGRADLPTHGAEGVRDWVLDGADIEYTAMDRITIPADLDLHKKAFTRFHITKLTSIHHIANNLFPNVDDAQAGHTYPKAIPVEKYYESNPEYFALRGGERVRDDQYCLSNPAVRELIYEFTASFLEAGYRSINILQPDGFRACQCEQCHALYGTGDDWGEKLWIFHRNVAERLQEEYPGRKLLISPYTVTLDPPESFDKFPDNVIVQHVDANYEETEKWKKWRKVHSGEYAIWLHNWVANQTSRYTPMRTPLFIEKQVKFFHDYNVRGVFRDGQGYVHGLEGPTYYVFARMFDDPENLTAEALMREFLDAAFGDTAPSMKRFYDELHHSIELYSLYIGTHGVGWAYRDIYGRGHKHVSDPFRMLGFLYPPSLLDSMEQHLSQAEDRAQDAKIKARLRLVRREFDYLKALMRVIHLYDAYQTEPNQALLDRLLTAIDARNALILDYYDDDDPRHVRRESMEGWPQTLFPPAGHSYPHLKLAYRRYQGAFKDTPLNWDTAEMRKSRRPDAGGD